MQRRDRTASGFLRRDLIVQLRDTITTIASRGVVIEGCNDRLDEAACSLVTELATSGGVPEIVSAMIDAYSTSRSVDGDLWTARALDDVVCDIGVFCRARSRYARSKVDNALKLDKAHKIECVIVRLLCRLALLVCRAAEMRARRNPARTVHIFEVVDRMLPTDLSIDEQTGHIKLHACDIGADSSSTTTNAHQRRDSSRELRAAVVASMRHHVGVDKNGEDARALVHLLVARCGRTLRDYNAMHVSLMEERDLAVVHAENGTRYTTDPDKYDDDDDESAELDTFLPLTFEGLSEGREVVAEYSAGRKMDVVWAIWRVLRDVGEDDSAASEFVTRMASLYTFRWAPSRREERINLILYASAVAMRGRVRCEEPEEDFLELIEIAEARAETAFTDLFTARQPEF